MAYLFVALGDFDESLRWLEKGTPDFAPVENNNSENPPHSRIIFHYRNVMKWLIRAVVVLATATFGTILVLGGIALHGVTSFDFQFGARYIVVSISHVLPWLVFADCIVIAIAIYLRRSHARGDV